MKIIVGLDDTDNAESRGTNQLARKIVGAVAPWWRCERIVRHQLLSDERIPYTSQNGSASILLQAIGDPRPADLIALCRETVLGDFISGSDPGLCVTDRVPEEIAEFGIRCQREVVSLDESHRLAERHGIHLEGLGGTNGGMIGALAAVGLGWTADDGRIVQWSHWPDDLSGFVAATTILRRGIEIRSSEDHTSVRGGWIDVGKHLRPNLRKGGAVLYVESLPDEAARFRALKIK